MAELISPSDVREIARLARLELTEREVESLGVELSAILEHMNALQALSTDDVEPMTHVVAQVSGLRADDREPSLPVETALAQAPRRRDDFFAVPGIIASATAATSPGETASSVSAASAVPAPDGATGAE